MPKPTTYVLLLVLSASAAFAQQASKPFRYSLPDKKGAFDIALPGIRIQQVSYKPDGSGFRLLGDGDAGLSVSVFLEILKNGSTSSTVRDSEWPKARFERLKKEFKARDFRPYEKGDIAFMEYIAPEYRGIAVAQKSVHAYYSGGQIWAEVHISKINYTSADETRFAKLLETARVVPDFTPGSVSYFGYGTVFYREQKYARAAEYLQRSLDLDVQDHGLGPTSWKVAVDNLGIRTGYPETSSAPGGSLSLLCSRIRPTHCSITTCLAPSQTWVIWKTR